EKYRQQFMTRMVGKYVGEGAVFRKQLPSAVIDLHDFDFSQYMDKVRHTHKGAAIRQARKADRAGIVCKRFVWTNFIPDIVEINETKEIGGGGAMRRASLRGIEGRGGAPDGLMPREPPACPVHATWCWGAFEPKPGHRQGEVVTDEKLVAYIKFKRNG